MKNDARKMALENQIELAQQNAIDFTHACMTIALHDVFGVGKDRLDKVTQRKDEINGELMRRMAIPAKNQKAQLNEAEKWLVGLLPEGVVSVFRVPVIKGVPRKRRKVQLKMAIDRAATLEWRGYATACAQVLGFGPRRLEKLRQETIANFGRLNEWVETDGGEVAMELLCRCACDALQTEDIVVENVDDEKTVQTLSRSYKEQEAEFLKRAVMMAAGRKACRQSLNVLNEESVRQKCADAMAAAMAPAGRRRL